MSSNPKVSYIVASYNHEAFIGDALRSILNQAHRDLEMIVVDDGSTDKTAHVAEEIATGDSRVRVIRQKNAGVVAARNHGVEQSHGELISIVDSDDLLPPERTALLVAALESNALASMAYGDAWIINSEGRQLGRFFENYPPMAGAFSVELFANYCFVPAISVMFRKKTLLESGPFWGPGPNTDYLKWIELGLLGDAICLRDQQLGSWRWHASNVSLAPGAGRALQYERIREALEELVRRHPELGNQLGPARLRRRYARCHFMGAFYAGLEGAWSEARRNFSRAIGFHASPLNLAAWISALPGMNLLSSPLYRLAERRSLKVRP